MPVYEVGKLFQPGITHYPEGVKFGVDQGGAMAFLFLASPTASEIQACRSGAFQVGFTVQQDIIFVLLKFGSMEWMDAPYSVHLSALYELAEPTEGHGYGLQVFLVDADTGILKVMRLIGLGTNWSKRFRAAILDQKAKLFDSRTYDRILGEIYRRYSTEDLVRLVRPEDMYRQE